MVNCPRCRRDVDELQFITPDMVTDEIMDSIDHVEEILTERGGLNVCAECMDELKEE